MPVTPLDSYLFGPLFDDLAVSALFADAELVRRMLEVEAALAVVQGRLGVIPEEAAAMIQASAVDLEIDLEGLRAQTEAAGVPVPELVRQLRARAGSAAHFVHWGATSQDIMDTALVLQLRDALAVVSASLDDVISSLASLADRHRSTLMSGRTHSQQALPIPFGYKVAAWLAPLLRHRQRLAEMRPRLLALQFGGAAGTLAALGGAGTTVQEALAAELMLNVPSMPWHTQRDTAGELAAWLALVSGSLAKMAQDVILMAQSEVGELFESADSSRGGSSTMPQKRNPMVSERIVAAARTNAALLSAVFQAQIQEHERATHGWQVEWLTLPQMIALSAGALKNARFLAQNLVVNEQAMAGNVAAANGLMMAEALTFALAGTTLSRAEAKALVGDACQAALRENRHLVDIVRERTGADLDWQALRDETTYFGAAETFIDRVVAQAAP